MKKALISPLENNRIAEVAIAEFPVAEPLFWVDCPDSVTVGWSYDGSTFSEPTTPPVQIPSAVSMRQARLALLQQGLLPTVNAAIDAGGEADKIAWEYATEVDRSDVLVQNLAAGLGLTSAQLDDLFLLASTL